MDLTGIKHDFHAFMCYLSCDDVIAAKAVAPGVTGREIKEEGWIWVKSRNFGFQNISKPQEKCSDSRLSILS